MTLHPLSRPACCLTLAACCLWPLAGASRTLLGAGAATEWKFLTGTNAPVPAWRDAGYDDAAWQSGKAPLGYGTPRLSTPLPAGTSNASVTTWFRREVASPLRAGEGMDILLCVDDGAVVHLNGREIARFNMPTGDVSAATTARRALKGREEGFYTRVSVPKGLWRATGTNVLAVEVHQASATDEDCFFDLALKSLPPDEPRPIVPADARAAMNAYYKQHFVGPGVLVPNGYVDGGRAMRFDPKGRALSGREILVVDRAGDSELREQLDYAKQLQSLGPLERAQKLAERVDQLTTPPGGIHWVGPAVEELTREFVNKPLRIGDVVDLGQAGVCRHRSLLFKILADEAGLKSALVRGNYAIAAKGPRGFPHAWNEIYLDDGRRLLVDVMHNGGKPRFPAVSDAEVVRHYLKPDDTPWYSTNATTNAKPAQP